MNTTKFFEKIASNYLTQIDIENHIRKITNNHDLKKLKVLQNDFQLFRDLYRGEFEDEITTEMIDKTIEKYHADKRELPIKHYEPVLHKETGEVIFEGGKEIDLEKIFFPFEMYSLNRVNTYIDELIKNNNTTKENKKLTENNLSENDSLKWHGTQTEFIELVKALIENGNIKGTQIEIINKLSNVFNLKIKHQNKLINDLKLRNNQSETLFLDKLKKSLFDYITLEKRK